MKLPIKRHYLLCKECSKALSSLNPQPIPQDPSAGRAPDAASDDGQVGLKRDVGLFSGIALIVGTMIGVSSC